MYYGGFTYTEAHALPVQYREWFIKRINREISGKNEDGAPASEGVTRAMHENTPDVNALMGRHRTHAPSRLHRFS